MEEDQLGDLRRNLFAKKTLGGGGFALPPYPSINNRTKNPNFSSSASSKKDFSPLSYGQFFDEKFQIAGGKAGEFFTVYSKSCKSSDSQDKPVIFLLHGGGYSGLTWACFANQVTEMIDCKVMALDSRGHGDTVTEDDYDLSVETQACDVESVIEHLKLKSNIFLMGHSMGGAIAVHVASRQKIDNLIGLAVIDVVEGSAMDALNSMQSFLRARPSSFPSIEKAIEWCVKSGQVRNLESARISMPGQIRKVISKRADSNLDDDVTIPEKYEWRIDLSRTEPYWSEWFRNLSSKFLSCKQAKLLILANVDRLDKELTIGQMQGKFQMLVLPKVGHCVQEDSPGRLAEAVSSFLVRNLMAKAVKDFKPVFPGF